MRCLPMRLPDGSTLFLDLSRIEEQPIFLDGDVAWEPVEQSVISSLVYPGDHAIDVGAHIGLFARVLAARVGPHGRVVAYEPDPSSLHRNMAEFPQVLVRTFAVGAREGTVRFLSERSGALSRVVSDETPLNKRGVRHVMSVTIDMEVRRLRLPAVDFLKIDVEGYEEHVIQGAARTLQSDHPPTVLFEWIPAFRDRRSRGAFEVLRSLVSGGWRVWRIGWGMPTAEIGWNPPENPANVLAVPPGRTAPAEAALRAVAR